MTEEIILTANQRRSIALRGNDNAHKGKLVHDAIRKAVIQGGSLAKIAKKLTEMAEEGDIQAIGMIADRLDGKPKQSMDIAVSQHEQSLDDLA